jgi:hypothetical protein
MEKDSLLCLQDLTLGFCPKPDESCPRPSSIIVLQSAPGFPTVFFFQAVRLKFHFNPTIQITIAEQNILWSSSLCSSLQPPFIRSSHIHIFFAALCAQVLNLDYVSHPHKTDCKTMIRVLAFVFWTGDDKENDSEANGKEHKKLIFIWGFCLLPCKEIIGISKSSK